MSTHFDHDDASHAGPPDDELRAGEYALGVLDASERRAVEERIRDEPGFALLVSQWEQRLSPWLTQVDPQEPSPHVWPRIRTGIGWPSVQDARPGLWNDVGFWRAATGLAIAAGIAAFVIGLRPTTPVVSPPPPLPVAQTSAPDDQAAKPVVVLVRDDGATGWLASIDLVHHRLLMAPVPSPLDASGRVNELWLIPQGEAPVSLGFVSSEKAHTVEVPASLQDALVNGATLAITLEPAAGMPHAAPSGAIVAKGEIASI